MSITAEHIDDGVSESLGDILGRYSTSADINDAIFNDLSAYELDQDVEDVLQTYTSADTSFWSKLYVADPGEYVGEAVKDFGLGLTAAALEAQKGLSLTITNSVKVLTTTTVTIEQAFIEYFEGMPVKAYVEKTTGKIVTSETVLSETTHIPYGKYLAGLGKSVGAYAIFESFKDTIVASYNASTGQEDTFTPLKEYLIASAGIIVGGVATVMLGGPTLAGAAAGAAGGAITMWAADTLIGNLPGLVQAAKAGSMTLQQTLDAAYDEIKETVTDGWAAAGSAADDILDDGQALMDDLMDGLKDLAPDLDLPPMQIPDWLGDALTPFDATPPSSPLCVDLDGDGVELTTFNAATTTTFFDLDGGGYAVQTAWVSDDDGLLARDINDNGKIDDVTELFGSPNIDGFALLAQLDTNGDLLISNLDDAWDELVIWQDADSDAVTDTGELISLATLNIVSIDLAGVFPSTSTISGNPISHTSTFKYANGSTDDIVDAWFVHSQTNSFYAGDYDLDLRTLFLPTLRGFGEVPDLHIAMSQNEDLLELVYDFTMAFDFESFADEAALDDAISDILYEWGGVQDDTPTIYQGLVDSRQLAFLEAFVGRDYPAVFLNQGRLENLKFTWDVLLGNIKAQLLVQVGAATLFDAEVTYDALAGEITGGTTLSQTAIDDLVDFATAGGVNAEEYWVAVARFLQFAKGGFDEFSGTEEGWLDAAIYASDPLLTWGGIVGIVENNLGGSTVYGTESDDAAVNGSIGHDTIYGLNGHDVLNGAGGDDILDGGNGNDTLNGGDGDDTLSGQDGNDTFNPGSGGNVVNGGAGNDIYYYGGGDDFYSEYGVTGADEIRLASGIVSGDLTFEGLNNYDLLIWIDGFGSIQIDRHFYSSYQIEALRFYDNSTLSLTSFAALTINGTAGDDTLIWNQSLTWDLTISGQGGEDLLRGDAGEDVLDGGDGNDTIEGRSGNDTYIASAGFDTVYEGYNNSGDILYIPAAYSASDVTLYRDGTSSSNYDLFILIAGLGQVKVDDQFASANNGIEDIVFENSDPSIDLQAVSIENIGTSGNDTVYGITTNSGGDDILDGRAGNDTLSGGSGDDTYIASAGNDVVNESGNNENDRILFRDDNELADLTIYRGKDSQGSAFQSLYIEHLHGTIEVRNQFAYSSSTFWYSVKEIELPGSVTIDLFDGPIETRGTSGADSIGGVEVAVFYNDDIFGYGGNDNLSGYSGNDIIHGGDDNDSIYGGTGTDTLYGDAGTDSIYGDENADTLYGGDGADTLRGGDAADTIYGDAGNDTIYGDTYFYETGADLLYGGDGDDTIYGSNGNDTLEGGNGADNLYGDSGADTFMFMAATAFNAVDAVKDFSTGANDNIDISDVLDGYYTHGVDVLTDFVQITTNGSNSELRVDTTGTATFGGGTLIATIEGVTGLTDEAALVTAGRLLVA